jgi:hypothetical protein
MPGVGHGGTHLTSWAQELLKTTVGGGSGRVRALAFSEPDGATLLVAVCSACLVLRTSDLAVVAATPPGAHRGADVEGVAVAGGLLVTGGGDGFVRLWRMPGGSSSSSSRSRQNGVVGVGGVGRVGTVVRSASGKVGMAQRQANVARGAAGETTPPTTSASTIGSTTPLSLISLGAVEAHPGAKVTGVALSRLGRFLFLFLGFFFPTAWSMRMRRMRKNHQTT